MNIFLLFSAIFLFVWFFILLFIDDRLQDFTMLLIILVFLIAACAPSLSRFFTTNNCKFKAIVDNEAQYYSKCKKENGHNICEADFGKEIVVDDFWKK